ncbi:MAG: pyridoxal phosphate-dependent aminotransferase [Candidatus Eremiobacteraeota bacterium]|nr:pyridoxal phosphate-dependent aminotransferase [Candidatus Eremiobacteraeota bacterium]
MNAIEPSLIRVVASKKKPGSIDLGLGEPTLLPQQRFIDAAARWVAQHGVRYTVNAGDPALRERIAAHYAYPGMTAARNVCVTTGSQEAVYVAIKTLLDPARDELLVVDPAFPAYAKMAALEGIAHRRVDLHEDEDYRYDVDGILDAVRPATRLICIASPANPTGRVLRDAEARRLAEGLLARDGAPVWVLQDEIYRELSYVDDPGYIARYYPHTVVANSLSKSNALTGMRVGWLIAPDAVADALVKTHAWITSTASAFGQRVAYEIFGEPGALAEQSAWYRTRLPQVLALLDAGGLRYVPIDGAFYVCVRLHDGNDSLAAALELVERRGVVAIPGAIFGRTLEGWLRLSWVAPLDQVAEGLKRIRALTVPQRKEIAAS